MSAQRLACVVAATVSLCVALTGGRYPVRAEEKRVVDQLLDILRQNKQITDQQYRELKRQAEQEREEDLRKAVAAPAPAPLPSPTVAVAAAPPPAAPSPPPGDTLRAYFKNGFNLESADGAYKLMVGALTQVDWAVAYPSTPVKQEFNLKGTSTGVEFRRARLSLAGIVFSNIDFKFEYDFAEQTGGQPSFKDVYIGMNQIPFVQYLRVGHFKEPFSLEELTPDTYTTFMERALPNAFEQPGSNVAASGTDRNTGFTVYQTYLDQRLTFATGAFRATNNFGNGFGTDSPYDVTARLTGLPAFVANDNLIHLGFSYSHKFRHYSKDGLETIQFASRPESHLYPVNLVNTGQIRTNGADVINPEVAFVRGPMSIQGEYQHAFVNQASLSCSGSPLVCTNLAGISDPDFNGFYVEGSYFLTGESRASFYRQQFGHFERVIPKNSFAIDGSHWGAWQVAARFSRLDLDTSAIAQIAGNPPNPPLGTLDDVTLGVNWYLNSVTKITVNYVWAHLEDTGDSNIVQGRFQLAF